MSWRELRVELPAAQAAGVSERLLALGSAGLAEEAAGGAPLHQEWDEGPERAPARVLLRAWFAADGPDEAELEAALGLAHDQPCEWIALEDRDWEAEARASFVPLVISETLTVAPPWNAPPGALVIEPGQGFGTGDHPTTRMALRALERRARAGASLLDVGCGSGILALAGARLGLRAVGIDVQPSAVTEARQNAARNGLDVSFSCAPLSSLEGTFGLVTANLHAELLCALSAELLARVEGWLILAGVMLSKAPAVEAAFAGLTLIEREVVAEGDTEWVALTYRRSPSVVCAHD